MAYMAERPYRLYKPQRELKMVKWLKDKCPVCLQRFEYPEGMYEPKTCSKFDCQYKYSHNPEQYKELINKDTK